MKKFLTLGLMILCAFTLVLTDLSFAQTSQNETITSSSFTKTEDGEEECPCGTDEDGYCLPCDDEAELMNCTSKAFNQDEDCECGTDEDGACVPCDDDESL